MAPTAKHLRQSGKSNILNMKEVESDTLSFTSDSAETPSSGEDQEIIGETSDTNGNSSLGYDLDSNWSLIFTDDNNSTDFDESRSNSSSNGYASGEGQADVISDSDPENVRVDDSTKRKRKIGKISSKPASKVDSKSGSQIQFPDPVSKDGSNKNDRSTFETIADFKSVKKFLIYVILASLIAEKGYDLFYPILFPENSADIISEPVNFSKTLVKVQTVTKLVTTTETLFVAGTTELVHTVIPETTVLYTVDDMEVKDLCPYENCIFDDGELHERDTSNCAKTKGFSESVQYKNIDDLSSWDLSRKLLFNLALYSSEISKTAAVGAGKLASQLGTGCASSYEKAISLSSLELNKLEDLVSSFDQEHFFSSYFHFMSPIQSAYSSFKSHLMETPLSPWLSKRFKLVSDSTRKLMDQLNTNGNHIMSYLKRLDENYNLLDSLNASTRSGISALREASSYQKLRKVGGNAFSSLGKAASTISKVSGDLYEDFLASDGFNEACKKYSGFVLFSKSSLKHSMNSANVLIHSPKWRQYGERTSESLKFAGSRILQSSKDLSRKSSDWYSKFLRSDIYKNIGKTSFNLLDSAKSRASAGYQKAAQGLNEAIKSPLWKYSLKSVSEPSFSFVKAHLKDANKISQATSEGFKYLKQRSSKYYNQFKGGQQYKEVSRRVGRSLPKDAEKLIIDGLSQNLENLKKRSSFYYDLMKNSQKYKDLSKSMGQFGLSHEEQKTNKKKDGASSGFLFSMFKW